MHTRRKILWHSAKVDRLEKEYSQAKKDLA